MNLYHAGVIMALIGFALSSFFYLQSFAAGDTRDRWHRIAYGFFIFSTILMTSSTINAFVMKMEHLITPFTLITFVCWITVMSKVFFDFRVLGTLVAPLSMLIILIQFLFIEPHGSPMATGPSSLIFTHIITSILGEAFAIIAFVFAVSYLMQQRALKTKQYRRLSLAQMPISKLQTALVWTLWVGFILMTSGLIMGAVYAQFFIIGNRGELLGKIIWAFLVWAWYLATLVSKNLANVTGKKLAWMTIVGFGLLAVGMFGINDWSYLLG